MNDEVRIEGVLVQRVGIKDEQEYVFIEEVFASMDGKTVPVTVDFRHDVPAIGEATMHAVEGVGLTADIVLQAEKYPRVVHLKPAGAFKVNEAKVSDGVSTVVSADLVSIGLVQHPVDKTIRDIRRPRICSICGNPFTVTWTDTHGIGSCIYCGAPYRVIHYTGESPKLKTVIRPPELLLTDEDVEICRRYVKETGKRFPTAYSFPGSRQRVDTNEDIDAWNEWCEKNEIKFEKGDEDEGG